MHEKSRLPVGSLPTLTDQHAVSFEVLIVTTAKRSTGKRSPKPELQQRLERIRNLPRQADSSKVELLTSW
jgi:hypothetical protein